MYLPFITLDGKPACGEPFSESNVNYDEEFDILSKEISSYFSEEIDAVGGISINKDIYWEPITRRASFALADTRNVCQSIENRTFVNEQKNFRSKIDDSLKKYNLAYISVTNKEKGNFEFDENKENQDNINYNKEKKLKYTMKNKPPIKYRKSRDNNLFENIELKRLCRKQCQASLKSIWSENSEKSIIDNNFQNHLFFGLDDSVVSDNRFYNNNENKELHFNDTSKLIWSDTVVSNVKAETTNSYKKYEKIFTTSLNELISYIDRMTQSSLYKLFPELWHNLNNSDYDRTMKNMIHLLTVSDNSYKLDNCSNNNPVLKHVNNNVLGPLINKKNQKESEEMKLDGYKHRFNLLGLKENEIINNLLKGFLSKITSNKFPTYSLFSDNTETGMSDVDTFELFMFNSYNIYKLIVDKTTHYFRESCLDDPSDKHSDNLKYSVQPVGSYSSLLDNKSRDENQNLFKTQDYRLGNAAFKNTSTSNFSNNSRNANVANGSSSDTQFSHLDNLSVLNQFYSTTCKHRQSSLLNNFNNTSLNKSQSLLGGPVIKKMAIDHNPNSCFKTVDSFFQRNESRRNMENISKPIYHLNILLFSELPFQNEDEESLLKSERTHFKPIKVESGRRYLDGTTFIIDSNIDSNDFLRTSSGLFYQENQPDILYAEYKGDVPAYDYTDDEIVEINRNYKYKTFNNVEKVNKFDSANKVESSFIFKRLVKNGRKIDKCMQTEEVPIEFNTNQRFSIIKLEDNTKIENQTISSNCKDSHVLNEYRLPSRCEDNWKSDVVRRIRLNPEINTLREEYKSAADDIIGLLNNYHDKYHDSYLKEDLENNRIEIEFNNAALGPTHIPDDFNRQNAIWFNENTITLRPSIAIGTGCN